MKSKKEFDQNFEMTRESLTFKSLTGSLLYTIDFLKNEVSIYILSAV